MYVMCLLSNDAASPSVSPCEWTIFGTVVVRGAFKSINAINVQSYGAINLQYSLVSSVDEAPRRCQTVSQLGFREIYRF